MASQMQCYRNHLYSGNPGDSCPFCEQLDDDLSKTHIAPMTDTVDGRQAAGADGRTFGFYSHLLSGNEPVVGWVACVEGPDLGSDWRLVAGRNEVGRSKEMSVCLSKDKHVSGSRHAFITYDPRGNAFTVLPGDSRGLVYLNQAPVAMPTVLRAYDRIELGKSVLVFVPLTGDNFQWPESD